MRYLILTFLTSLMAFSCQKSDFDYTKENTKKIEVIIDEYNVGYYHNQLVEYFIADLLTMNEEQMEDAINDPIYISNKLKEFCTLSNIPLPNDEDINESVIYNDDTSLEDMLSHEIFESEQSEALTECFNSLEMNNFEDILDVLTENLTFLEEETPEGDGRTIAMAIVNQLIASTELWIEDDFINIELAAAPSNDPSQAEVLGADGKALGTALLFGGWTTPIGWCGSMFIGAGASIGTYIDSNWWPY